MPQKRNRSFYMVIAAIVLLLLLGVGIIIKSYRGYVEQFIELQDVQQLRLAQSVDRNIESLLNQSRNSLEYIISMEQFQEEEEKWLSSGKYDGVLRYLTENHLYRNQLIAAVTVLQNGQFDLDEHGRSDFQFLNDDTDSLQRICQSTNGKMYLALICPSRGNISYASMIDLELLYREISSSELMEADQLILLDENCSVLHHFCTDSGEVKSMLVESCPKREDFQLMLSAEAKQEQSCHSFIYQTQKMSRGYNAHIMILPSGYGENSAFAIGLISNIDLALKPLQSASLRWLLGGSALFLGIGLLLFLVLYFLRRDVHAAQELELLRQKNIAMEELNRKTQEMAHRQRLEMLGTLTSGIAHEFNNLLSPIMGYSMLTLEQLPPEQEEIYDNVLEIYNSSRKAKEIISQLSLYSRKNSNENHCYLVPDALLQKVLRVAMPACPQEVTVETDFNCGDAKIYGNETQLSQLFLNLILNAFHAMGEQEKGQLSVSAHVEAGQALISIKDSGCGISADVLAHIFEPFFTTKEGGKGSGLGLAIAQQIAENHQGHIEVLSEEGKGSTFIVRLPAYFE